MFRLSLPSKVIEDGEEETDYDSKSGTFVVKISKLNKGEHFEGLDLLTKLLSNESNKQITKKSLIEVIDGQEVNTESDFLIDEDFDWHLEQTVRHESDDLLLFGQTYGFADQYSAVVARIVEEFNDLIDIKDPEHKSYSERREERLATESEDFNDDHYLSDLYDQNEIISNLNSYEFPFCDTFSDDQRFKLKDLPKKEYILEKCIKKKLLLGMIDILFGYAYDMRVNEGDHNVESGWTVCKLSATLSWFDSYDSLKEVIITSIRRSLCYPLYREWSLSLKVLEDVIRIIELGQNCVLNCFLDIHKMFNESGDGRYLLNDLYITDYCVWLQSLKSNTFESLATALQHIRVNKSDVNLDLDVLERAAKLAIDEQRDCHSNESPADNSNNDNYSESNDNKKLLHNKNECNSKATETPSELNKKDIDKQIDSDDDSD
ncbi:unnamed protein product [Oppiella nova]|uniref:Protein SHQ1 homolog n=1 Tax=Oppiella nova TaxID=334625 RepID=A0A7R9LC31_9ACAR|nr:unnamed protein product [Oppiella nova]CAG2161907.1 unnamed protein product [Oppiella nova]